jgi:carbon-monoxide dehydrogenase iron sulfur subunit
MSVRQLKRINYREEFCMGCGLCELYCLVQHSRSKDVIKAYKKEHPRPKSRIEVEVKKPNTFAVRCQHCEEPQCVSACLSGAMSLDDETGLVIHDSDKCIGCWTCIMVCPYSAVKIDSSMRKIVCKCDMCLGLETPACVLNCPNEALVLEEVVQ